MSISEYPEMLLILPSLFFLFYTTLRRGLKSCEPTDWPIFGMIPGMLASIPLGHDYVTEVLNECGGAYTVNGGWFTSLNMVFTSIPADIHYVFSKNFANYPKGPEFHKIFEILGDGIFNADHDLWELHRRTTLSLMTRAKFYGVLEKTVWDKVERGLLPVLEHFSERGTAFDLQDIFQRFTFDNICKLVLEYDPDSLCVDLPYIPCEKAFFAMSEPLLFRHLIPESIWQLQKWLKIGIEKNLIEANHAFDDFLYPIVQNEPQSGDLNIMAAFRKVYEESNVGSPSGLPKFLRDTALNLMLAGKDTTSACLTWLFWLVAKNPECEMKILEEICSQLHVKQDGNYRFFSAEESHKLTYLHGALCESLRLFPPVAVEHKAPASEDTLPSGLHLHKHEKLIFSFITVGRMESVWGKDCLEFKPERWITERGAIRYEPSYKFPAFNVGPRTCIGKEMAFVQMKMIAASIIYHYKIRLVEGQRVFPRIATILHAKDGLKVQISRRNI